MLRNFYENQSVTSTAPDINHTRVIFHLFYCNWKVFPKSNIIPAASTSELASGNCFLSRSFGTFQNAWGKRVSSFVILCFPNVRVQTSLARLDPEPQNNISFYRRDVLPSPPAITVRNQKRRTEPDSTRMGGHNRLRSEKIRRRVVLFEREHTWGPLNFSHLQQK